jgi:T5SS/PEP-CTERM-associated repeat protein
MNRRLAYRLAAAVAVAAGSYLSADADGAIRTWNAPNGGTFSVGTNWLGGVAPINNDAAVFDLSDAYTVNFTANSGTVGLTVRNDTVTFDLAGFSYTTGAGGFTGGGDGDISRLTVANGTFSLGATTTLGGAIGLRQTLTIASAGTLNTGTLLNVGSLGEGSLVVTNGGAVVSSSSIIVGTNAAASGMLLVSGFGSSLSSAGVAVGGTGPGAMSVVGGASANISGGVTLGSNHNGLLTVSGAETSVTVGGPMNLGFVAQGELRVDSGASVTCGSVTIGLTAGTIPGASAVVDGFGTVWNTGTIVVGGGNTGTMLVSGGGLVSSSTMTIGNNGKATVTGGLSRWSGSALFVGASNSGALDVLAGGHMTAGTVQLGVNSNASGNVHVSGAASLWDTGSNTLVGVAGNGDVTVDDGGSFKPNSLTLGANGDSFGTVTVRDAGSAMTTGTLTVGDSGTGVLVVDTGGRVTAMNITTAGNISGSGSIRVTGPGSRFTAPDLTVGNQSSGDLIAENGGIITIASTGTLNVGSTSAGHGDLTVTGPGSTLSAGTITLGQATAIPGGSATLRVSNGGAVNAANKSFFTQNGVVTIDGGGLVNVTGGLTLQSQTDIFDGAIDVGTGGTLDIFGRVSLHSTAARLSGGTIVLNSTFSRLTGGGRIYGVLTTQSGSEISVGAGEQLLVFPLNGAANIGGRLTLVDGGVVDFGSGQMSLTSTGRLSGRGTLKSIGLTSNGTISLSGGSSEIFGPLTNNATAKVFVAGNSTATFYDNVTNLTGSSFQVSAGSTAVFFGNVTGLSAFTGTGVKDFEGGVNATGGLLTVTGDTIVGGSALVTATSVREHSLTLSGRLTINPNGTNAGTSRLNQLIIEGDSVPVGTLDLSDNDLLIDYAASGETSPRPLVESQIRFARNGGTWNRAGISSSSALSQPSHATTLGVLEGTEFRAIYGPSALFSGQSVDDSSVLVKYTWYGDTDFNGRVNFDDYVRIDQGFNNHRTGWLNGDLDYNGVVNFDDYVLIDLAFNTQSGTLGRALRFLDGSGNAINSPAMLQVQQHLEQFGAVYAAHFLAAVPEPGLSGIASLAGLGMVATRQRRFRQQT